MATAHSAATNSTNKGKAPSAIPLKAAPEKETTVALIPRVNSKALSKDVGPAAVKLAFQSETDAVKAQQLGEQAKKSKYAVMAMLTQAIVKAARADKTIDLTATAKSGPDGAKAMNTLNDQIGLALGLREVITVGEGDKAKEKVVWTAAVKAFFVPDTADKDSDLYKKVTAFRGNFVTQMKRAAMAAMGIVTRDIETKIDKESGTLLLSGPEIKKQFGQPSVLLNERQTVANTKKGGDDIKLKEKPSFTAIAAKAKEAAGGAPVNRSSNTRGAAAQSVSNPGLALAGICKAMIEALQRTKDPTKAMIQSVKSVESTVELFLSNWDTDAVE